MRGFGGSFDQPGFVILGCSSRGWLGSLLGAWSQSVSQAVIGVLPPRLAGSSLPLTCATSGFLIQHSVDTAAAKQRSYMGACGESAARHLSLRVETPN